MDAVEIIWLIEQQIDDSFGLGKVLIVDSVRRWQKWPRKEVEVRGFYDWTLKLVNMKLGMDLNALMEFRNRW